MNNDIFEIDDAIRLLNGVLYKEVIETNQYKVLVSHFKSKSYNLIMPTTNYSSIVVNEINVRIAPYWQKGFGFSYYIEDNLRLGWETFIEESLKCEYNDLYVYGSGFDSVSLDRKNVVSMNKDNFEAFLRSVEECFSDWEENYEFMKWMLDCKEVTTLGVMEAGRIVSFGSYVYRDDSNMVLLLNDGTIPAYRRQGLHSYLIKYRCNEILAKNGKAIIYADLEKGSGSHLGFCKLGFKDGPLYWVYSVI